MNKKYLIYAAIFILGVYAGPKVPILKKLPGM
jgi:hypothetical protein